MHPPAVRRPRVDRFAALVTGQRRIRQRNGIVVRSKHGFNVVFQRGNVPRVTGVARYEPFRLRRTSPKSLDRVVETFRRAGVLSQTPVGVRHRFRDDRQVIRVHVLHLVDGHFIRGHTADTVGVEQGEGEDHAAVILERPLQHGVLGRRTGPQGLDRRTVDEWTYVVVRETSYLLVERHDVQRFEVGETIAEHDAVGSQRRRFRHLPPCLEQQSSRHGGLEDRTERVMFV